METTPTHFMRLVPQILLGLIAAMATIPSGMHMGFPSVALTPLTRNTTDGHLDEEQASWFASISSIATPLGCLMCGPLLDKFGRRLGLLALAPWFTAGWLLLVLCPTQPGYLFLGRVVAGLATGFASVPGAIFLGEISNHTIRGMLVVWPSVAISFGIFAIYGLGALFKDRWQTVALISTIFPLAIAFLTYIFVPETPVWLLTKGRVHDAEISFKKLRNVKETEDLPEDLKIEFLSMNEQSNKSDSNWSGRATLKTKSENGINSVPPMRCFTSCKAALALLLQPQAWKPLIILNLYFFFQQFSGIYVVVSYAVDMIHLAGVDIDAYTSAVVLATIQLIAGIVISFFLTRCGRRPLSIVSGAGMTICMFTLAVYLQYTGNGAKTSNAPWIPLTALSLYVLSNAVGFHTLPWAMIGEMYPARISGLAGGITTFMAYLFNFFSLKMYPMLKNSTGAHGVFYLYGSLSLLATVFVAVFLPETHRKSLHEIEEMFIARKCNLLPCSSNRNPKDFTCA